MKIIKPIASIITSINTSYVWYQRISANSSIAKVDKMLAAFNRSKMMAKPGATVNKATLIDRDNPIEDAYLVGTVHNSAAEASVRAHEIEAILFNKKLNMALMIQTCVVIVAAVLGMSTYKIPAAIALFLMSWVATVNEKLVILQLQSILVSPNFITWLFDVSLAGVTYFELVPARLKRMTSLLNTVCKILLVLI